VVEVPVVVVTGSVVVVVTSSVVVVVSGCVVVVAAPVVVVTGSVVVVVVGMVVVAAGGVVVAGAVVVLVTPAVVEVAGIVVVLKVVVVAGTVVVTCFAVVTGTVVFVVLDGVEELVALVVAVVDEVRAPVLAVLAGVVTVRPAGRVVLVVTRPVSPAVASAVVVVEGRAVLLPVVVGPPGVAVAAKGTALPVVIGPPPVVLVVPALLDLVVTARAVLVITPGPSPTAFRLVPGAGGVDAVNSVVAVDEGAPVVARGWLLVPGLLVGVVVPDDETPLGLPLPVVRGVAVVPAGTATVVAGSPVVEGTVSAVGACSSPLCPPSLVRAVVVVWAVTAVGRRRDFEPNVSRPAPGTVEVPPATPFP
jgi:hypothetical protein